MILQRSKFCFTHVGMSLCVMSTLVLQALPITNTVSRWIINDISSLRTVVCCILLVWRSQHVKYLFCRWALIIYWFDFICLFWNRVLHGPGWPQTLYVAEASPYLSCCFYLKVLRLQSSPTMLGFSPCPPPILALWMLVKHSTGKMYLWVFRWLLKNCFRSGNMIACYLSWEGMVEN